MQPSWRSIQREEIVNELLMKSREQVIEKLGEAIELAAAGWTTQHGTAACEVAYEELDELRKFLDSQ